MGTADEDLADEYVVVSRIAGQHFERLALRMLVAAPQRGRGDGRRALGRWEGATPPPRPPPPAAASAAAPAAASAAAPAAASAAAPAAAPADVEGAATPPALQAVSAAPVAPGAAPAAPAYARAPTAAPTADDDDDDEGWRDIELTAARRAAVCARTRRLAARTAVGAFERTQHEARAVLKKMQQSAHKKYMYWFLKPVLAEEAPAYAAMISRPVDHETMGVRLERGEYETFGDFAADVRLMWTNALNFNSVRACTGQPDARAAPRVRGGGTWRPSPTSGSRRGPRARARAARRSARQLAPQAGAPRRAGEQRSALVATAQAA